MAQASQSPDDAAPPSIPIPSNIPREDYATPALYSLGIMGRAWLANAIQWQRTLTTCTYLCPALGLFRYSIYGSVFIVLGSATVYLSLHAYVEYIGLQGFRPIKLDEPGLEDLLPEEIVAAYSGAHLGGGTDPSLGWRARFAARGAWIAQNLSAGGIVPGSSGKSKEFAVPDSAWLEAERLLSYALANASPTASREGKMELLALLADIRSRLAGPRGLSDSRRSYQQLIMEVLEGTSCNDKARWLLFEAKLAEVDGRIATELLASKGDATSAAKYSQNARARLSKALCSITSVDGTPSTHVTPLDIIETRRSSQETSNRVKAWLDHASHADAPHSQAGLVALRSSSTPTFDDTRAPLAFLNLSTVPAVIQRSVITTSLCLASLTASSGDLATANDILHAAGTGVRDILSAGSPPIPRQSLQQAWLQSRLATILASSGELAYALISEQEPERHVRAQQYLSEAQAAGQRSLELSNALTKAMPLPVLQDVKHTALLAQTGAARSRAALLEVAGTDLSSALQLYEGALASLPTEGTGSKPAQAIVTDVQKRLLADVRRCREKLQCP
jgi:hypothetical protein